MLPPRSGNKHTKHGNNSVDGVSTVYEKERITRAVHGMYNRGVSTLEILVALAVISLSMTAVILLVFGNQSVFVDTQNNIQATQMAQSSLEDERALSRQDFDAVVARPELVAGIFTKKIDVEQQDAATKKVASTISWSTNERNLSVSLTTILVDVSSSGGTCAGELVGDWKHPHHIDYRTEELVSQITGTSAFGLGVSDVKVFGRKMYVAAHKGAGDNKTFYIFELAETPEEVPLYRGRVSTAPSASNPSLGAIAIAQDYAYVANATVANFTNCAQSEKCSQLQIINVSDAQNPVVLSSLKMPNVTGSGGQAIGKALFYKKGYVYLGLVKTAAGHEFHIIDVGGGGAPASPSNPIWKGSTALGRTTNSIVVENNYAYIVSDDNNKELSVVDISNKSAPAPAGSFNAPGSVGFGYGYALSVSSGSALFGRSYVNNAPELYVLDTSNPTIALPVLGTKDIGTSANPDSVNSLLVRGDLVFALTNKQFQVWNVADWGNIYPWSADGTTNTFIPLSSITGSSGGSGVELSCTGEYLYAAIKNQMNGNRDIISVFTSAP